MQILIDSISKLVASLGQINFIIALSLLTVISAMFALYRKKNFNVGDNNATSEIKKSLIKIEENILKVQNNLLKKSERDKLLGNYSKEELSRLYEQVLRINGQLSIWVDIISSLEDKIDNINLNTKLMIKLKERKK